MKLTDYQKKELVWMRDQAGEKWEVIALFYGKSVGRCCSIYKQVKRAAGEHGANGTPGA